MARGIRECGWEVGNHGRLFLGGNSMDQIRRSLYKSLRSHSGYCVRSTRKFRQALKKTRSRASIYKPDPKPAFTEYHM